MNTELVERLRALNAVANDGRGSSTIRGILLEIDRGDEASAKAIWSNDGDKLWQNPELNLTVIELLGCRGHHVYNCKNRLCVALKKDVEKWMKAVK